MIVYWYGSTLGTAMPKTSIDKERHFLSFEKEIWLAENISGGDLPTAYRGLNQARA